MNLGMYEIIRDFLKLMHILFLVIKLQVPLSLLNQIILKITGETRTKARIRKIRHLEMGFLKEHHRMGRNQINKESLPEIVIQIMISLKNNCNQVSQKKNCFFNR